MTDADKCDWLWEVVEHYVVSMLADPSIIN